MLRTATQTQTQSHGAMAGDFAAYAECAHTAQRLAEDDRADFEKITNRANLRVLYFIRWVRDRRVDALGGGGRHYTTGPGGEGCPARRFNLQSLCSNV